ncbi:hypothetical protein [Erwinia rhapontici]|uniref:hypothetical protein n=1 Tax=Erwinia rhapontici TaxID=55212 RepID=UPI002169D494|nr:hypothetical protein [Erwinia rhapontici]MCS3609842.1 hypothetical protein [Erwinia rhapontici]
MQIIISGVLVILIHCFSVTKAYSENIVKADVAKRYSSCSLMKTKNGTFARVNISFNAVAGIIGSDELRSRAILFYTYSKEGIPVRSSPLRVEINSSAKARIGMRSENGYVRISGQNIWGSPIDYPWGVTEAFTGEVLVYFYNDDIESWAAVAISSGVDTLGTHYNDNKTAYITFGSEGSCRIIVDPENPPEPDVSMTATAPDWDLGEIKSGEQIIPFSSSQSQFCLEYDHAYATGKKFVINASSQNGAVNNHYQLIGLQDNTQIIPYQLTLDSGSNKVDLPNVPLSTLPLLPGGKTCFLPTFRTFAPKGIKKGDYSDVLTFNIATKA